MGRFKTSVLVTAFSILALIILGIVFVVQKRNPDVFSTMRLTQQATGPAISAKAVAAESSSGSPAAAESATNSVSPNQPSEPTQFGKWLKAESQSLNKTGINMAQKEIEMRNLAQGLSPGQKGELVTSALNTGISANERILATYLLSLNSSQGSEAQLLAVAGAPLPDLGSTAPHSEGEIRRVQELSLRYIMVDELAKRAIKDSQARTQLENMVNSAVAPEVRTYARRKLSEIESL